MKRLAAGCLVALLAGCATSQDSTDKAMTHQVTYGTKSGASTLLVLDYHNDEAQAKYQNYQVRFYLANLPEQKSFEICEFETDKCQSQYSVWQNPLRPDQNGVWFSYALTFPMALREESGVTLVDTKFVEGQTFLEWDKGENLHRKILYVEGGETQLGSMTATAYSLQ
ncbi:hypothetical protein OPW39_15545 [Vibrio europaeus]|uniref:hypothetical protein n=1 Tax=Vibrio europaeus TaxID=300876 RepID=UPI00233F4851|nr:hypothetical protein [Vibrio europaeus]MDC5870221.1 hypothetical protein [Vibrio europaeus]